MKPKLISVFFIIFAHSLVASFWYLEDEVRFEKIPSALEIIDGYKNSQNLRDNDAAILDKIAYFLKISDRKEHLRILDKKLNDIDEETIKKRYPNISQNNFFSFLIEEEKAIMGKIIKQTKTFIEDEKLYNIWTFNAAVKLLQGGPASIDIGYATLSKDIRQNILGDLNDHGLFKSPSPLDYDPAAAVKEIVNKRPSADRLLLASSHTDREGSTKRENDIAWNKDADLGAEIIGDINDQSVLEAIPDERFMTIIDNSGFGSNLLNEATVAQLYRILKPGGQFYVNGDDGENFSKKEEITAKLAETLRSAGFELIVSDEPIPSSRPSSDYAIVYDEISKQRFFIVGARKKL